MMLFLQIIYWLCVVAIVHSYVLYPILLRLLAQNKSINTKVFTAENNLPTITIMMAVYNEEKVLEEKLESIFNSDYPIPKIQVLIGSDSSTDRTHEILDSYIQRYPKQLSYTIYQRQGKANILNQLQPQATGEVYIFTDANVIFTPKLIFELAKHFKNPKIGQVGANFINRGIQKDGISVQEKSYIKRETLVKYREGLIWGTMMGAFGGCHAIRASIFVPNPPNFLMEDFYISMHIMAEGYQSILELEAKVIEDVSNEVQEEFKRKIRISAGNFQNLGVYYPILFRANGLAFSFLSHKILRWLGPLFIILTFAIGVLLGFIYENLFYQVLFLIESFGLFVVPLLDYLLKKIQINIVLLRYIAYFNAMNLALLTGFFKYLKGVKTNVWQPTKRNAQ